MRIPKIRETIMKAIIARKIALDSVAVELRKIYFEIEKAAEQSRTCTVVPVSLKGRNIIVAKLLEDGYDIESNNQIENVIIRW